MASPQKENGYVPIANELVEQLARTRISGEAMQVLWVIIRKTYGFNKREDFIAGSQICEATGLRKQHVYRATQKLIEMNIVTKKGYKDKTILSLQKDFDKWVLEPKKVTVTKKGYRVTNIGYSGNQKRRTQKTKDNNKDTIETQSVSGEVVMVIDSFSEVNSSFKKWYANKTQRAAILRLLETHGIEQLLKVIKLLPQTNAQSYFPSINNPTQLEDKWSQLENALKRKKQEITSKKPVFI